jgi:DeoR/GlpR family transcriptional regulator of sugar metabolism
MLRQHTDVIAMTNGMNVANALLEAEGVELLMTGGHLRRQSQSFMATRRNSPYRITILICCSWASMPSISIAA